MLARVNLEDAAHDEGHACSPAEGVAREESELSCQVCTEPLNDSIHRPAAGACEHFDVCALCYLRLRLILKENGCPMCKTPLEHVYVFESPKAMRPFSSLSIWGTEAGPGYSYDDRAQVWTRTLLVCVC